MNGHITIGVLSLQGSAEEHLASLSLCEAVTPLPVKTPGALERVDALILPGGESTAIVRLLHAFGLFEPVLRRAQTGMPIWGTCAGMVLLAKELVDEPPHFGLMDILVRRNAYGSQINSFALDDTIPAFSSNPMPLIFIRAPWIEKVGPKVQVLHTWNGHITAARQRNLLATAFHPELTFCPHVHRFFARMVRTAIN